MPLTADDVTVKNKAKERPILFSAPMVLAILDSKKTQTRRILKADPLTLEAIDRIAPHYETKLGPGGYGGLMYADGTSGITSIPVRCPYGAPGDRLWVKETWRTAISLDADSPSGIGAKCLDAGYPEPWAPLKYEVDNCEVTRSVLPDFGDAWGKTRVSIHMPRWASRITLDVTGVRVERLHDISEEDAKAEGATPYIYGHGFITELGIAADPGIRTPSMYRAGFEQLWREINGCESWDTNPWVWVVEFRRVESLERAAMTHQSSGEDGK